jgi:hypothetical protein
LIAEQSQLISLLLPYTLRKFQSIIKMQLPIVLIAALAAAPALAFTNGSLIPSYICNPVPDGLPKSFGELLPHTEEQLGPIAFNANNGSNLATPPLAPQKNLTGKFVPGNVGNSAYILASFHNTLNSLQPIIQGLVLKTLNGGPLVAGQANQLSLNSGAAGVNLDGALVYAFTVDEVRVGSFTDKGGQGTFANFPGCGKNAEGEWAGTVHQQIISNNESYSALFFNVPACVQSANITLKGLSVTDNGFGVFDYSFAVVGSKCTNTTTTKTNTNTNIDTGTRTVEELITIVEEFHTF